MDETYLKSLYLLCLPIFSNLGDAFNNTNIVPQWLDKIINIIYTLKTTAHVQEIVINLFFLPF